MPTVPADEEGLTRAIVALASAYGRYGYRHGTALLQTDGWRVGKDRVQRIWRREGLEVPSRHKPRSRLWLNDGSGKRLRPLPRKHVWGFDFVQAQTLDGRSLRILTLIDEHSRACCGQGSATCRRGRTSSARCSPPTSCTTTSRISNLTGASRPNCANGSEGGEHTSAGAGDAGASKLLSKLPFTGSSPSGLDGVARVL